MTNVPATDPRIPEAWHDTLWAVKQAFPEAVIAGGAVRDLLLGKLPPKDIDIFVRSRGVETVDMIEGALDAEVEATIYLRGDDSNEDKGDYDSYSPELQAAYMFKLVPPETVGPGELPELCECDEPWLNVIVMDQPMPQALSWGDAITNDFDLGINRIYYDGVSITVTAAFVVDAIDKTFTVLRARNEKELDRIKTRIERLKRKYPEFKPKDVEVKS